MGRFVTCGEIMMRLNPEGYGRFAQAAIDFAVAFFMVGTLAAGLSSVFPILMVAPLLVAVALTGVKALAGLALN